MAVKDEKDPQIVPPELEDLADRVGTFIQYWGFKKIHGRIWTHLYLSEQPLDAGELMSRLKISKALMSFSLNDLLDYQVIFEVGKSPRNTILYSCNTDIPGVILNVIRKREKRMLASVESSFNAFLSSPSQEKQALHISSERTLMLGAMISLANSTAQSMISLDTFDFGQWNELFKK